MVLEKPHSQTLKEQKDNIENYAEHVDFSDTGNGRNLKHTDVVKRFHRDKDENNDDFIQMERTNESGNEKVPSHGEAFVAFVNELRWFEAEKESNCILVQGNKLKAIIII